MSPTILGVDPGTRHTGIAILLDGKIARTLTVSYEGKVQPLEERVRVILEFLEALHREWGFDTAVVEEVVWQGRRRRGMMPLALLAGAITGYLVGRGIPTYLIVPSMKRPKACKGCTSQHELDAVALANWALDKEATKRFERRKVWLSNGGKKRRVRSS